jgi:hypothetical protein
MSKRVTADKRKYVTFTLSYKLQIIGGRESGESRSVVMASYKIGSSPISDIKSIIHKGGHQRYLCILIVFDLLCITLAYAFSNPCFEENVPC